MGFIHGKFPRWAALACKGCGYKLAYYEDIIGHNPDMALGNGGAGVGVGGAAGRRIRVLKGGPGNIIRASHKLCGESWDQEMEDPRFGKNCFGVKVRSGVGAVTGFGKKRKKVVCDSVFIKRVAWTSDYSMRNGVRVICPGCEVVVGYAKPNGLKCICGHWQRPGIQLLKCFCQIKV